MSYHIEERDCLGIETSRDIQKHVFEFVYRGTFNVNVWKERRDMKLRSVELCMGTHGYSYALIKIGQKKRASQLQKIFEAFDREATPGMQIKLTNLPDEPVIVSFRRGGAYMNHVIFREIETAREIQCQSYFSWNSAGNQDTGNPL